MKNKKINTYFDELIKDEGFRVEFEKEYYQLFLSEKRAKFGKKELENNNNNKNNKT